MIRSMIYTPEKGLEKNVDLEIVSDLIESQQNLVWLEVIAPTEEDIKILAQEFNFHPLALEDIQGENQRPKMDMYEDHVFLVTLWLDEDAEGRLRTHQLSVFIGANYMVTVHITPLAAIRDSEHRVEQNPVLMRQGIGSLVYFVMDNIVDSYFPVLDRIEDRMDELERKVLGDGDRSSIEDIFALKRDLLTFRKVVAPLRDAFNQLTRQDQAQFTRETLVYFQDVYDHLLRLQDLVDTYRDILTGTMDAYLSTVSNRMSAVVKTLTVVATVALPLTIVPSIYGMNFKFMPELRWRYGYPFSLCLMLGIGVGMWLWIKRKGWWS